jgi:hypothetical protein
MFKSYTVHIHCIYIAQIREVLAKAVSPSSASPHVGNCLRERHRSMDAPLAPWVGLAWDTLAETLSLGFGTMNLQNKV